MYAIISYGFPVVLVVFEWGLRTLLQVDASLFMGPTLAAAGLTILAPLTRPKDLGVKVRSRPNVVVVSRGDHMFVGACWITILAYLFAWSAACYASVRSPSTTIAHVPAHFFIGATAYVFSIVMVAIKERV